jgi:hypothetical protein
MLAARARSDRRRAVATAAAATARGANTSAARA